ncbi:hypothetical protein IAT38_002204 [Cryptococcus sp. DSM 104549]
MRSLRPSRSFLACFLLLSLALPSLVLADTSSAVEPPEDVCKPLRDAEEILLSLQPPANAHLDKKVSGAIAPFGSQNGWGDDLGLSQDGPISATLRIIPRLLNALLDPIALLSRLPLVGSTTSTLKSEGKVSKVRRERIVRMLQLMEEAEKAGCTEAYAVRGRMRMFPPKGVKQDLHAAYAAFKNHLKTSASPASQFMVGFFHATGLGGATHDQGKALLYYKFAAEQGYRPALMTVGYRHWAGIGVQEDCGMALEYYQDAAEDSYKTFLAGPPGGRTLPLTPTRLSDRVGGIYGPHASWASTGANAHRPAIRSSSASARGETETEILEYYQYHSDRDSHLYTVRLGRLFYHGSVYFSHSGVSAGAEGVGEIPQSYSKAREYFLRVARVLWPVDFEPGSGGKVAGRRKMSKEMEDGVREPAMVAAAFLGRMALRGEGQKPDYARARLWYERAAELGDREAHNGLGIIYRDGLAVTPDLTKATQFFQAAASSDLAEAQVNLAKLHLARSEVPLAIPFLEVALRHGSTYEAFHLSAGLHAANRRTSGNCGVAVAYEKLVAERGSWGYRPAGRDGAEGGWDDWMIDADRAWARGEGDKALIGWWISGEMGYEAGQNNVAFLLEQGWEVPGEGGTGKGKGKGEKKETEKEKAEREKRTLALWVRSAAQDNVDALVKVGDHYYQSPNPSYDRAAAYYQTAADTQTSAMAYWNLGFMYENGQGVKQDWHLAKRFYDLAGETSHEAYLPVVLSLGKLYLRSWWVDLRTGGAIPGLPLFEPPPPSTDLPQASTWQRLKALFTAEPYYPELDAGAAGGGGGERDGYDGYDGYDTGLEPEYDGGGRPDEDGWQRHYARRVGGDGDAGLNEELWETWAEMIEDFVVVGLVFGGGLLWLVRMRWAAQERRRREEEERRGGGVVG